MARLPTRRKETKIWEAESMPEGEGERKRVGRRSSRRGKKRTDVPFVEKERYAAKKEGERRKDFG